MIKFKVVVTVTPDEMARLLEKPIFVGKDVSVSVVHDTPAEPAQPEVPAKRAPRGSKVETAIRGALLDNPRPTKELKTALERAGLNPNSLGAALSKMKREGQVSNDSGEWKLTANYSQAAQ